LPPLFR